MNQANAAMIDHAPGQTWRAICGRNDLVPNSGVVALVGNTQVALFQVIDPSGAAQLFAVDNRDPVTGVNVIGRGIIGNLAGDLVIASPLYKQHYRLEDGTCLEDATLRLRTWAVRLEGDVVQIDLPG